MHWAPFTPFSPHTSNIHFINQHLREKIVNALNVFCRFVCLFIWLLLFIASVKVNNVERKMDVKIDGFRLRSGTWLYQCNKLIAHKWVRIVNGMSSWLAAFCLFADLLVVALRKKNCACTAFGVMRFVYVYSVCARHVIFLLFKRHISANLFIELFRLNSSSFGLISTWVRVFHSLRRWA